MYIGQLGVISNREDWVSDFTQLIDEDDGSIINILNPDIGFDCSVYIADENNCRRLSPATIADGGVVVTAGDDGPGFQWTFRETALQGLCAGTYRCGVKVTANGQISDVIVGSIAVIEGNR